ncbi:MAG: hypothetical protein IPQ07_21065 [Myxococcales bacterium]|nr:hypothetical protein [Myxococcales bacterium]
MKIGLPLSFAVALTCAACGPKIGPGGVSSSDAIVHVHSNVRDAQVFVDGRYLAPLTALGGGVAIEAGVHRFELRHDDYFSSYLELKLARAERRKVTMELAPVLP